MFELHDLLCLKTSQGRVLRPVLGTKPLWNKNGEEVEDLNSTVFEAWFDVLTWYERLEF